MMMRNRKGSVGWAKVEHRKGCAASKGGNMHFRKAIPTVAALVTVLGTMLVTSSAPAGASSSPADQGVTATTIQAGNPYVDFPALKSLGVNINEGSFPDAYSAIAAYLNAHGGFDGRKVVMKYAEMDPAVASSETGSCNTLTEDDHVFVSFGPVFPDCYQSTHDTTVFGGSLPGTLPAGSAPDFTLLTPAAAFDPLMFANFVKRGVFKGKKIGIFYGATSDAPEVAVVQKALKALHVDVVGTALDSAVATDAVASDQDTQTIAQKFQNEGVGVVVGVGGSGSTTWPRAQLDNQSTYKPLYIPTSESSLLSYVESAKGGNPYLKLVLTASPTANTYQEYKDPAIRKCVSIVKKAYPSDEIDAPLNPTNPAAASVPATATSVMQACQFLYMFQKIADGAGKKLTTASFAKAGESLKNVTFPGSGGPVSFAPGKPYAVGPVNVVVYSPASDTLVPASATAK
jgi:hypothetical protein